MDFKLLTEVKRIADELKTKYDELYCEPSEEFAKKQISLIYQVIKTNIKALYKIKENIILKDNDEYKECSIELKPFISNLLKLSMYFMREQENNINKTQQRLKNGDSDSYLKDEQYKSEIILIDKEESYEEKCDQDITKVIDSCVDKIIYTTKKRYIRSFGVFSDRIKAHKLIEKEYNDSTKYIEIFLLMQDIIYENFDNFDILITLTQNVAYELIQLYIELDIANETKLQSDSYNKSSTTESLNVCFVIMDGLNSTIENTAGDIIDNTMLLNSVIAKSNTLKTFCKFKAYKQDEVHGYVVAQGGIKEFIDIVDNTYRPKMKVAYSLKSLDQINHHLNNVSEVVYNLPFNLYGTICTEARKQMEYERYSLLGGKKINELKSEIDGEFDIELYARNNHKINDEINLKQ